MNLRIFTTCLSSVGFFGAKTVRRRFIYEVIRESKDVLRKGLGYVLVAPPGIGKTALPITYVMTVVINEYYDGLVRVVHSLPLRSLADDIALRFKEGVKTLGLSVDGESVVAIQYGLRHESPYYLAHYVLTTIDMYVANLLKIPTDEFVRAGRDRDLSFYGHYEVVRASLLSALNVFDEAHLMIEHERGWSSVLSILKFLAEVKTPFILMTATLPEVLIENIKKHLGSNIVVRQYFPSLRDDFYISEVRKKFIPLEGGVISVNSYEEVAKLVDKVADKDRVALIVNTVKDAIRLYRVLRESYRALLLHSRYTLRDRERKVASLRKGQHDVIVSTQVIEAGIDASFNVMISELAPITSLIQRFGRLARLNEVEEGYWLVFFTKDTLQQGVYDVELLKSTLKVIRDATDKGVNWHVPVVLSGDRYGFKKLLDNVFIRTHYGFDVSKLSILENPFISSEDVMNYILRVRGGLLRESHYLPIYVGNPPSDYEEFLESAYTHMISSGLDFTYRYLSEAFRKGFDVGLILLHSTGELKVVPFNEFMDNYEKLISYILRRSVIAAYVPKELYCGGIEGEGLRMP